MSTIVVSTQPADEESTSEVITLKIVVEEEDWLGSFNQLQVFRSLESPSGPFEELTADSLRAARIPKSAGDPPSPAVTGPSANVAGSTIELAVGDNEFEITIAGPDPVTYASVASQIVTQGLGELSSYVDSSGRLAIESTAVGTTARLQVTGGDAASVLGLPITEPDNLAFGKEVRIPLVQGTSIYTFADLRGSSDYWYRTRFFNKDTLAVSDYSLPFTSGYGIGVEYSSLVVGVAELVGLDGKPLTNREVRVHTSFNGTVVDGKTMAGGDVIKRTDSNGRVEFSLVRGQSITVAVPGTTLFRTITVPTDLSVELFNLFDPSLSVSDVFRVNVPEVISAERRSL